MTPIFDIGPRRNQDFMTSNLCFDGVDSNMNLISPCVLIGLVIVVYVCWQQSNMSTGSRSYPMKYGSSAMSAMKAMVSKQHKPEQVAKSAKKYTPKGETTPSTLKLIEVDEITPKNKEKCTEELHKLLSTEKDLIIFVFAPWCAHCHNMMPLFRLVANDRNAVMVNGDCLTDEMMSGKDLLPTIEYFPTLLFFKGKTGHFTKVKQPEELANLYDEKNTPVTLEDPQKVMSARTIMLEDTFNSSSPDVEVSEDISETMINRTLSQPKSMKKLPLPSFTVNNSRNDTDTTYLDDLFN